MPITEEEVTVALEGIYAAKMGDEGRMERVN